MPISLTCPCGKRLRARDELAGKRVKCPSCGESLCIPDSAAPVEAVPNPPIPRAEKAAPPIAVAKGKASTRYREILAVKPTVSWREFTYWLLLLPLIPLAVSLLSTEKESFIERFTRTLENAPINVKANVQRIFSEIEQGRASEDDLIELLPDGRVEGAHLARSTYRHYFYALLAVVFFFGAVAVLAPKEAGQPLHLFWCGLFTATVGVALLLVFQLLAEWTQGRILISRNVFIMAIYWLAWAIGFSYSAATRPDLGFLPSFLGYTFGVGLCEEVSKAIPLVWHYRQSGALSWRESCIWGLASGIGFGVAEGIMYSANYYNGVALAGAYMVRFVSCVALHGIWTASVALFIHKHQTMIQGDLAWHDFIPRLIFVVSIPMILHGFYDTCLKKDLFGLALVAALASFAWLAWRIEVARGEEAEPRRRTKPRLA